MDKESRLISMVNTRGRVMRVHAWEVDNLRRQGCKVIYNPKEEYYPQYDLENKTQVEQAPDTEEVMSNTLEQSNILDVEEV